MAGMANGRLNGADGATDTGHDSCSSSVLADFTENDLWFITLGSGGRTKPRAQFLYR